MSELDGLLGLPCLPSNPRFKKLEDDGHVVGFMTWSVAGEPMRGEAVAFIGECATREIVVFLKDGSVEYEVRPARLASIPEWARSNPMPLLPS